MADETRGEGREEELLFYDAFFHQKRKKGQWRIIDAPFLEAAVADTHAHVHLLKDPALSLARAGANDVGFLCDIVDVFEDGRAPLDGMEAWRLQGSFQIRQIARGGC